MEEWLEGAFTANLNHLGPAADDGVVLRLLPGLHPLLAVAGQVVHLAEELPAVHLEGPENAVVEAENDQHLVDKGQDRSK